MKNNVKQQSGFTILEVLVAAIIMMVSLLGMGALQSTAMKKNISAMNKTQAMEAVNYIGDALRSQISTKANLNDGIHADYDDFKADYWGASNSQSNYITDCGAGCSRDAMVKHMLAEWERMIGEGLPKGKGLITPVLANRLVDGTNMQTTYYKITLMWDDRQMAMNDSGGAVALDENCSGNPKVSLTCYETIIQP